VEGLIYRRIQLYRRTETMAILLASRSSTRCQVMLESAKFVYAIKPIGVQRGWELQKPDTSPYFGHKFKSSNKFKYCNIGNIGTHSSIIRNIGRTTEKCTHWFSDLFILGTGNIIQIVLCILLRSTDWRGYDLYSRILGTYKYIRMYDNNFYSFTASSLMYFQLVSLWSLNFRQQDNYLVLIT